MADAATGVERLSPGLTDLQQMIAESRLQQGFQCAVHRGVQVAVRIPAIPGFQFGRNVATLAHQFPWPLTGTLVH